MVVEGIILGLIVGLIRGGLRQAWTGLARMRLRAWWIFPLLVVFQLLVYLGLQRTDWVSGASAVFFMAIYAALIVFLWINRGQAGFKLLLAGVCMNFLVMLANGGRMPVSLEMAELANPGAVSMLEQETTLTKHMALTESTRLPLLGDVIPVTAPYPIPQVVSLGDLVMNAGMFWFLVSLLSSARKQEQSAQVGTDASA